MTIHYYHRDGSVGEFFEVMAEWEAGHVVAQTEVGEYWVSTVWLPIDHAWFGGSPLRFESMVFKGTDMGELDMARYSTEEQALAGHAELVAKWRTAPPAPPAAEE